MIGLMDAMAEGLADGGAETLPDHSGPWHSPRGRWAEDNTGLWRERVFEQRLMPIFAKPVKGCIGGVLDSRQHGASDNNGSRHGPHGEQQ